MKDDLDKIFEMDMKDQEFATAYNSLENEYKLIQAIIDARKSKRLTQKQLAEITGINQADISRIETGTSNPTINMIQRVADGLNMQLKLEFLPK